MLMSVSHLEKYNNLKCIANDTKRVWKNFQALFKCARNQL